MRARGQELDGALRAGFKRERFLGQFELAGLDLGEVQDLVDERQQRARRLVDGVAIGLLLGCLRRIEEQAGHAEDAVHRRADLVAHGGEKAALGAIGGFRLVARLAQLHLGAPLLGHVAADALHLEVAAAGRCNELLLPFNPPWSLGGQRVLHEVLLADVVGDGERRGATLFADVDQERLAEDIPAGRAEHVEKRPIGERQVAHRVATNDGVLLRVEQGAVARFVFAQLPLHVLQAFQAELDARADALQMFGAGARRDERKVDGGKTKRHAEPQQDLRHREWARQQDERSGDTDEPGEHQRQGQARPAQRSAVARQLQPCADAARRGRSGTLRSGSGAGTGGSRGALRGRKVETLVVHALTHPLHTHTPEIGGGEANTRAFRNAEASWLTLTMPAQEPARALIEAARVIEAHARDAIDDREGEAGGAAN